jgi:hypothetical protein
MHIDDLSVELAKNFSFTKLPPKLRYRLKQWLKNVSTPVSYSRQQRQRIQSAIKNEIVAQILDKDATVELKKNEMMASSYSDGTLKLDFGSEVPEKVKKAAMGWAKKKGLKVVELSLNKAENVASSMVLSANKIESSGKECLKRIRWAF